MLERRSALAAVSTQDGLVRIEEVRGWSLVQVSGFAQTRSDPADLERAIRSALSAKRRLLRISATQYWIISPDGDDLVRNIQAAIPPDLGAVVSLTHSRVCIAVEGQRAAELLSTGIPLDFHRSVFGVGHFAMTGLHHTPVMIQRVAHNRFELYATRTFAQSVWHWLVERQCAWPARRTVQPSGG